jgi:hypothetical protein
MGKNKLIFVVEIEFDDSIRNDDEVNEVRSNIVKALYDKYHSSGLAPEDGDVLTESFTVYKEDGDGITKVIK